MNIFNTYRPKNVTDFIPDSELELAKLKFIVQNQITFPSEGKRSIILHGQYGSGKTALAKLLPSLIEKNRVEEFCYDQFKDFGYIFLSCSATGGSLTAKMAMPTSVSFHQSGLHYVILDEVDNLRSDAQKNMKSFITEYDHVIYIMTTNHLSNMDKGLISRSHCISFENPSKYLWKEKCLSIFRDYAISPNEQWLQDLLERSKGDARTIFSELEIEILNQKSTLEGI